MADYFVAPDYCVRRFVSILSLHIHEGFFFFFFPIYLFIYEILTTKSFSSKYTSYYGTWYVGYGTMHGNLIRGVTGRGL